MTRHSGPLSPPEFDGRRTATAREDRGVLLAQAPGPRERPELAVAVRVLVGAEQREERRTIASCLRRRGYEVVALESARELLEFLDASQGEGGELAPFDAVIVDVSLPGQSRQGLVVQIRRIDPELPVIVLATAEPDSRGAAFSDGADAVLEGPCDLEALHTVLRILLNPIVF